jgi:anti-sigma regulatory factor (Ser/Thr protein kinase)
MPAFSITVPCVSMDVEAVARSVRDVRRRLVAFAAQVGADRELQARVALAVTEAVTNVVLHA